jgi:hypothetical protein
MQMPIPQKGARASCRTEKRHGSLAIIIAAATLVPWATRMGLPFTVIEKSSLLIRADSTGPSDATKSVLKDVAYRASAASILFFRERTKKYTGTPRRTMPKPGQVVVGR